MAESGVLEFFLNGECVTESHVTPSLTLARYLRTQRRLVGTKLGCGTGGCGACTVMLSRWNKRTQQISHAAVLSCLVPLTTVHGAAVTTVEGIGSAATRLHPVQEALVQSHGVQCGFCSPGVVMSMYALLRNNPCPQPDDVITALEGNLCRCTGYTAIIDGLTGLCTTPQECKCIQDTEPGDMDSSVQPPVYDPTQEPIFPPQLQMSSESECCVEWRGQGALWLRPYSLRHLLELRHTHQGATLVAGHTALGFLRIPDEEVRIHLGHLDELGDVIQTDDGLMVGAGVTFSKLEDELVHLSVQGFLRIPDEEVRIHLGHLDELGDVIQTDDGLMVGAGVTFSKLEDELVHLSVQGPPDAGLTALLAALRCTGAKPIRNMATVGGHVALWAPNSDLTPLLMALGGVVVVASIDGERRVTLMAERGGSLKLSPAEIIRAVILPHTSQWRHVATGRQSRRKAADVATVSVALVVDITMATTTPVVSMDMPDPPVVQALQCVMSGLGATLLQTSIDVSDISGRSWDEAAILTAVQLLDANIADKLGIETTEKRDKRHLALGLFFRAAQEIRCTIENEAVGEDVGRLPPGVPRGVRAAVGAVGGAGDPVGQPVPHRAARLVAAGEAVFLDDLPPQPDELHAAFVLSARPCARLLGVDAARALTLPGVVGVLGAHNVPGDNTGHGVGGDETLFAESQVTCVGHVIAAVFADSHEVATRAAKLVQVQYEDLPSVITIQDAIEQNSFFSDRKYTTGDICRGFAESEHVTEGEFEMGGQEHFYLEPQCARAVVQRGEGEVVVDAASQWLNFTQGAVCRTLGIARHKVVCRAKRLGGAFGGKATRSCNIAATAALGAYVYGRPTRMVLSRHDDMLLTGGRHPTLTRYKVGFSPEGVVRALKLNIYFNGGNSLDVTATIADMSLMSYDNGYRFENVSVHVYSCRTNLPSNTACRAFGVPQMLAATETCMTLVAEALGLPQTQVREQHLFVAGDAMPFNMTAEPNFPLRRCWDQLLRDSDYLQRLEAVHMYNRCHTFKKKGLSVMPLKYAIRPLAAVNKGAALVHIYTDGTVLISHGGVEMGQGLHTKLIQIAAYVLCVPMDMIHISDTSTDKIPNAETTGSSSSTDLWGAAVKDACEKLVKRLHPLKETHSGLSWQKLVELAFKKKINLSALGYFFDVALPYDFTTGCGQFKLYYTYGAVCSEVVLDCLTGDHTMLRVDAVVDVGRSLNPAIDIGQIEGAFLQGYGLFTLEQLVYDVTGRLVTLGPGNYKLPTVADAPRRLHVSLLRDSDNPHAVYSSKGIGEPMLSSGATVWLALRDAVSFARGSPPQRFDSPATAQRLRLAVAEYTTDIIQRPQDSDHTVQ